MTYLLSFLILMLAGSCGTTPTSGTVDSTSRSVQVIDAPKLTLGIERMAEYLPQLNGKRVGLVVNQTTIFPNGTHLADTLLAMGVNVKTIFAPEHGFRGEASAGATIKDGKDSKTGLPIISLYGKNKKPSSEQLAELDVVIFDIQDVGVRYSTLLFLGSDNEIVAFLPIETGT